MSCCYARILTKLMFLMVLSGCQTAPEVEPIEFKQPPSPVKIQSESKESNPVKVQVLEDKQTPAVLNLQEIRPSNITLTQDEENPEAQRINAQKMQELSSQEDQLKLQQEPSQLARLKASKVEAESLAANAREELKRNAHRREAEKLDVSNLRARNAAAERQAQIKKKAEMKIEAAEKSAPVNAVTTVAKARVSPKNTEKELNLADFPLLLNNGWILDRKPNPITQITECVLSSVKSTLFGGYDTTSGQLVITPEVFYFNAGSNLDLSYAGNGVVVDGAASIEFEGLQGQSSALIRE